MTKLVGAFGLVLHSHIPYVLSHGKSPHGTDWLCEAAAESYLQLLDVCHQLISIGISPKITLGLTPVLLEQLADDGFKNEFSHYLRRHVDQANADEIAFRSSSSHHMANLARFWAVWYQRAADSFEDRWNRDLVDAFRRLQDLGHITIFASSATHAYMPLVGHDSMVAAQIDVGIETYIRHFNRAPRGFWLPECGYRPRDDAERGMRKGIDEYLSERGIDFFFVESQVFQALQSRNAGSSAGSDTPLSSASSDFAYGDRFGFMANIAGVGTHVADASANQARILAERTAVMPDNGLPALVASFSEKAAPPHPGERGYPAIDPYTAPAISSPSGGSHQIRVFTRDPATGLQVWSGDCGYPGDPWHLEFHKHHDGSVARSLGLRYWRITDRTTDIADKEPYEPAQSSRRVAIQALHFASLIRQTLTANAPDGDGITCSIYDTELFGHWWFEGPQFLYNVIVALAAQRDILRVTCDEYLDRHPASQTVAPPPAGSWGAGGDDRMWKNGQTMWVWDLIYRDESTLRETTKAYGGRQPASRLLKQAKRELMLMSSSDWLFALTTGAARDYASVRVRNHHDNFVALIGLIHRIAEQGIELTAGDLNNVAECELTNRVFGEIGL